MRPETVPTRPRLELPGGERRGTRRAPLCPSAPGPLAGRVALAQACAAAAAEGLQQAGTGTWAPRRPAPPAPPAARRLPTPAQPLPHRPRPAPRGPPRPPPRPRPPPAPPAPPARRGPRKTGQRARSPQQEILAGLGAAEGAAAPGSGGSGIIFYQRRDQLPHPVTGPYTKAPTDLEKLGRPEGERERRGAGMGPYRAASRAAAAATTTRGAGGRRSTAPKSPTQKSPLRLAEGHGERRGGAQCRAAQPRRQPEPGSGAARAARGQRFEGPRHLPWGAGIILLHKHPRQKGLGGGIRPACRLPRMRGGLGKGGEAGTGGARHVPSRFPAGGGQGAARQAGALGRPWRL